MPMGLIQSTRRLKQRWVDKPGQINAPINDLAAYPVAAGIVSASGKFVFNEIGVLGRSWTLRAIFFPGADKLPSAALSSRRHSFLCLRNPLLPQRNEIRET